MPMTALLAATAPHASIHSYDEWQIGGIVIGGIIATLTIIGGVLSIVDRLRGWSDKAKSDDEKQTAEQRKALAEGQETILRRMAENREALERSIHEKHSDNAMRIERLEDENKNFRPGQQIDRDMTRLEGRVEHEKSNRLTAQDGATRVFGEHMSLIMELQRGHARLEAQNEATSGALGKMEASIDKLAQRMDEKLDKLSECLTAISRKVG